ncbi:hypothetical protein [Leptospira kanakyensis]|uniref:Uncharacterized protein n=1 Tax=Leptospira kanakyensis TaxID=2484968 RepID=A0A6N4Q928_9LEPT|nr:hypothetical protein [Leptospira kanakyensis]MCW7480879.1 hypothetical protein [Leptospira kanakyensis]TGK47678.1 hypothetical protein EHQ11_17290 [Leptospira kanakyensis]TGK63319.1 hypothetical protein EHQ16_02340 [Leptospira kanakyensis]TGK66926.1 hypothetical protein EHQ18_17575 [Leptospira kanakyensis]
MKKILISCFLALSIYNLDADERKDIQHITKYINEKGVNCSCTLLYASEKDQNLYSVNYYAKDGFFKMLLNSSSRQEAIQKWGNKRKWLVSKNQGVGESLYLFHEFREVNEFWDYSPEFKVKNIQDIHNFAFKNYCEVGGKISEDFARIKKLKITFFESKYQLVNNMMSYALVTPFKKTESFEISFPNEASIVQPMPAYKPVGHTENSRGNIFLMKLTVLEVYSGKEGQPLCAEDFYLGEKWRGEYIEVLKQIDKI